jgi:hypothetical protein
MEKIFDYFENFEEYPTNVVDNPIPYGTLYSYISSTFLNGFINYTEPIKCYLIDRYTPDDEIITVPNIKGPKKELKEKVLSGEIDCFHTDLDCFEDDIIILSKIQNNKYRFFWFDMDVSDCSVGKFETTDSQEDVIQSVVNWLDDCKSKNKGRIVENNLDNGIINYTELPLSFLKGWIKF